VGTVTINKRCQYCAEPESPLNPFTLSKIVGGLRIGGDSCLDKQACMTRRLALPQTYTAAHTIVLTARMEALRHG
jgi:hypothetical protein